MRRHSEAVQLPATAAMGGGARDGRSRRGPVRVTATLGSVFTCRRQRDRQLINPVLSYPGIRPPCHRDALPPEYDRRFDSVV